MIDFRVLILAILVLLGGCDSAEQKTTKFYQSGQDYFAQQKFDAAKIEYTNALRTNDSHIPSLYGLSRVLEIEKNWESMEQNLNKLLELDPDHIQARISLTNLYIGSGRTNLAVENSAYLMKLAPEQVDVKIVRAAALFKVGNYAKAADIIDEVLATDPANIDAAALTASQHVGRGDAESALAALAPALDQHPTNSVLLYLKLRAYALTNNFSGSIPVYQQLMTLHPNNTALPDALARGYLKMGQFDSAVELFEGIAASRKNVDYLFRAIELVNAVQGVDAAEQAVRSYLVKYPTMTKLHFALADIYIKKRNVNDAKAEIRKVISASENENVALEAMNRLARLEMITSNHDEALTMVDEVIERDPQNISAISIRSYIWISQGKAESAIRELRTYLRNAPKSTELLMTLAKAHESEQQWELANENYARAVKASDGNPQYKLVYANYLLERKQYQQAEELISPLYRNNSNNEEVVTLYAKLNVAQEDWPAAEEATEALRSLAGDSPMIAQLRSRIFFGKNDVAAAIKQLEHLQTLAPDSVQATGMLVNAYLEAGRRGEAEALIRRIIAKDEKHYFGHLLLANLYIYVSEYENAERSFEAVLALNPKMLEAHTSLIQLLLRSERNEDAEAAVNRALQTFPKNSVLLMYAANIQQRNKNLEAAKQIYSQILVSAPGHDVAANNLASLLLQDGSAESLARAETVADRFRQSQMPQFQDTLGRIYTLQGKLDEAIYLLKRAAAGLPSVGEVRYHLGHAYVLKGDKVSASIELTAALKNASGDERWLPDAKALLDTL
ncbi:tetratricopeptide repeat protein [Teredinibacter waterburyi]|uniref:tetratricopeptide repeat protein n=1 Tax=Teredinibacter waterburyi TaxID=1500538 RepID=UPI00165EFB40|nr:tetratricopeptide repeat protein [Teredinibacter waterburyi]